MIQQNTTEWHKWRNAGIGASEAPIILGISPYKTALELWEQKTGKPTENKKNNFVQDKGHRLEEVARAKYELDKGNDYPAQLVQHSDIPYIRASLDGRNTEENHHIEVKYVGKKPFVDITNEKILLELFPHYYCQIQYQLMITNGTADLVLINDALEIRIIPIPLDVSYIIDMVPRIVKFWDCVTNKVRPELSPEDSLLIKDKEMKAKLKRYGLLVKKADEIGQEIDSLKEDIYGKMTHPKMNWGAFEITTIERQGSVDYSKVKELKGVDLNQYRKSPSTYKKISIKKS